MISVEHLTKYYGDFLAVEDLSFEIGEGHVYGFLGPNFVGGLQKSDGRIL